MSEMMAGRLASLTCSRRTLCVIQWPGEALICSTQHKVQHRPILTCQHLHVSCKLLKQEATCNEGLPNPSKEKRQDAAQMQ